MEPWHPQRGPLYFFNSLLVLRLEAFSAAFTRPLGPCMDLPNVTLVEKASEQQRRAPASTYAIDALSRLEVPSDARVVTISGPPDRKSVV